MSKIVISETDLNALKSKDEVLAKYIDSVDIPLRYTSETFFIEVVKTLIGQLISTKAASTIYSRLDDLLTIVNEDNFLNADKNEVLACGISERKYSYVSKIASDMKYGILDYQDLYDKSDEEIINILIAYPGIGLWSAEMLLIHGLKRPDVLAYGDLGIRKGICEVYGLEELSKDDFNLIKERLSPYGTIASLYFWKAYSGE